MFVIRNAFDKLDISKKSKTYEFPLTLEEVTVCKFENLGTGNS